MRKFWFLILSFTLFISIAQAQPKHTLDKIAAVVGASIILQSDIELKYATYLAQGNPPSSDVKCQIAQSLITQKLLAAQAIIDSIDVKDDEVDADIDRRMRGMIQRAGGEDRLEGFLGRSIIQYKDEIRPDIREELVAQKMQQKNHRRRKYHTRRCAEIF